MIRGSHRLRSRIRLLIVTKRDNRTKKQIKMMVKHSLKRIKIIKMKMIWRDCRIRIVPAKRKLTSQTNVIIKRTSHGAKKYNNNHLILLRRITLIITNRISNHKNNSKLCRINNKKMTILLRILGKLKIRILINRKNKSRSQMAQKKNQIIKVMTQLILMH